METADSPNIKYAPGTSAPRNVGNAGAVVDTTATTDENENTRDKYPGDYWTMRNYYDPERHDIWGDSEDDQLDQKAPSASVLVTSSRPTNAACNDDGMPSSNEKHDTSFNDANYTSPVQTIYMSRHNTISNSLAKTKPLDTVAARTTIGVLAQDDAPPRARFPSLPNMPQTAVRSSAPRHDNGNQPPRTTDRTEHIMTAVRSLAPRPWHTTVRRNGTTPWRPRHLYIIGLMTHIILLLLHSGDSGVEPCSPPANTTNLTTYRNSTTYYGMTNGGAERCSPPTMPTITTVRSPAPRPCHYPNHTVNAMHDSAKELHQRLGIHPVVNRTPLPWHIPQCSRTRNRRKTAFSHRSTPTSHPHHAWRCRSVIVSGAEPPVCLPARGQSRASNMPFITSRHTYPHHTTSDCSTKDNRSETTTRPRLQPQPHPST